MVLKSPANLNPRLQLERVNTQTDEYSTDDSLSNLGDENLSFFPPQPNSPLLPNHSSPAYLRSPSFPYHHHSRLSLNRICKCKLSLRSLKMMGLVLLCMTVMICLMNIPWSGLSTSLAPDLYKYQSSSLGNQSDPLDLHHLSASDGSIHASFIGLGASIQSLMVKDRSGSFRDIVLGYDNISQYLHDPAYPRFGSIVGRYANRIKNSTFTLSGRDKRTYKVTPNEHNDQNTLHGGKPGWDRRPFDVQNKSLSQITFSIVDPNGEQGFPNQVVGKIEYELLPGAKWRTRMTGVADGFTPIMLSSHVYWNLDAYAANSSASDHLIQMNAPSYIVTDGNLIPTGEIASVAKTALDFNQSRTIGSLFDQTKGLCGTGCIGYDNAFVYHPHRSEKDTVMEMWSEASGIKMSVITDQSSAQIYTCNAIEPIDSSIRSIPRKSSHHGPNAIYENHSCVVIEQQSFIDGINNPQWGLNQIYGPDRPYEWNSIYHFTTL